MPYLYVRCEKYLISDLCDLDLNIEEIKKGNLETTHSVENSIVGTSTGGGI